VKTEPNDYEIRIWYSPAPGDECFVAQVVDLPGVMAHGDTREEAAREIQSALHLALETYAKAGETPPTPRDHNAAALGALGGRATTLAKQRAARRNGARGGRPAVKQRTALVGA
jgi:predicted RNase H-like HicB family nuclease